MTFGKHLLRGAALSALAIGLTTSTASAQANGSNYDVYSNGLDVVYIGIGNQPGGGLGSWVNGEDMKGTVMTALGDWGYRQIGWRESACVLGADPGAGGTVGGLAILWPNIAFVEMDGRNGHVGDVFTNPLCVASVIPGITSGGFVPYGFPSTTGIGAASFNFLLAGYPSGAGFASLTLLLPNGGLVPSSHGGTATLVANTGLAGLLINSTGFCWVVDFNWLPSALVSLDDVDGWWHYMHNSPDANQYWGMSSDEANTWQSNSVGFDGAGLQAFFANLDYEYHSKSVDPTANVALAPTGFGGAGTYYSTTVDAGGGNPTVPGAGFDLGRHTAWSATGTGGSLNPNTGLGNQDPLGAGIPALSPTIALATWNNEDYDGTGAPAGGFRLTWITIDWDATFGLDPAIAGEATVFGGAVRVPSTIPASVPAWPQPLTSVYWPFLIHNTVNHDGSGLWPDPNGFPSGQFGVPGVNGTSIHLPSLLGPQCIGAPLGLQFGSSGLLGPGGPLTWIPDGIAGFPGVANAASNTTQIYYLN